ncbi:MAG: gliding motility-associated C-terminal domain-containing protein, partial [bacterium]|nr:gliding motility-associated C-terminal domain-containing protein [bacterium]
ACDDGDPCTINDVETVLLSDGSICVPCAGQAAPCGTDGSCEQVQACDDGDPCTINDVETVLLSDGSICVPCAGQAAPCGTDGSCEQVQACDDGDPCTINDVETILLSDGTICVPCAGIPQDCDDGATTTQPCDDGDPNTFNDEVTTLDCDGSVCIPCSGIPCNLDLEPVVNITNESCFGENDGSIVIESFIGGQEPYLVALNDGAFVEDLQFSGLEPGVYTLTVQDAEGCETATVVTVSASDLLFLDLNPEIEVALGDSVQLSFNTNAIIDSVIWTFDPSLSCTDCLAPFASPSEQATYTVTVIDENGCIITAQTRVIVDPAEKIYIPNVFSPNDDGINDTFVIYGGANVSSILSFRVFDRWGGVVFLQEDIPASDSQFGWNGTYRGQEVNPGIYLYSVQIALINGTVVTKSGEVILLK